MNSVAVCAIIVVIIVIDYSDNSFMALLNTIRWSGIAAIDSDKICCW
jgi:tryptophan-rich sensory protein